MSDESFWSANISAHRKLQGLTQEYMAERLGVTTSTISRWESGRQSPDIITQQRLKRIFGIGCIMSSMDWLQRVNSSHGREILVRPNSAIVAISEPLTQYWNRPRSDYIDRHILEFVPGGPIRGAAEFAKFGIEGLQNIGLFEGIVRQLFLIVDFVIDARVLSRAYDVWPVRTSTEEIFAHFVGHEIAPEHWGDHGPAFRIRHCEVRYFEKLKPTKHNQRTP